MDFGRTRLYCSRTGIYCNSEQPESGSVATKISSYSKSAALNETLGALAAKLARRLSS
jgi:hypothetical protein